MITWSPEIRNNKLVNEEVNFESCIIYQATFLTEFLIRTLWNMDTALDMVSRLSPSDLTPQAECFESLRVRLVQWRQFSSLWLQGPISFLFETSFHSRKFLLFGRNLSFYKNRNIYDCILIIIETYWLYFLW